MIVGIPLCAQFTSHFRRIKHFKKSFKTVKNPKAFFVKSSCNIFPCGAQRRRTFLLLRVEPATSVFWEGVKAWTDFRHGSELWNADWHSVQNSKAQLMRVHTACCMSESKRAGEPQRTHDRRDSCCLRDLAAWKKKTTFTSAAKHTTKLMHASEERQIDPVLIS